MVLNLNGTRKEIPSCYEQLTTRQYELLIPEFALEAKDRDHFKIFQIICGTDFKDYHATSENEVTIWNAIRWIYEQPFEFGDMPKVIRIVEGEKDRVVTIPTKITKLSIGQNIVLKQIISKAKYLEENLSSATAVYLQPLFDDAKFDEDRADELKKTIEEMPVYLIRPIGFFLLTNASKPGKMQTNLWQKILSNLILSSGGTLQHLRRSQGYNLSRT